MYDNIDEYLLMEETLKIFNTPTSKMIQTILKAQYKEILAKDNFTTNCLIQYNMVLEKGNTLDIRERVKADPVKGKDSGN